MDAKQWELSRDQIRRGAQILENQFDIQPSQAEDLVVIIFHAMTHEKLESPASP